MHGIAVAIQSVCLSVRHVYCDKTKWWTADILIPHEMAITLSFLTPTVVGGRCPVSCQIFTKSEPPPSKNVDFDTFPLITSQPQEIANKFNYGEQEIEQGFPTSYRWSVYVTPKFTEGGSKSDFGEYLSKPQLLPPFTGGLGNLLELSLIHISEPTRPY